MKPRHIQPKCVGVIAKLILHLRFACNHFLKSNQPRSESKAMQEEDPLATNLQIGQQLFKFQKQLF